MIDLTGKVAIVTGAAQGQGAATAATMAAHGAKVVIADINADGGEQSAKSIQSAGGEAISIPTDVGQEDQLIALIESTQSEYGRLDILHNNAADLDIAGLEPGVVDMTPAVWDKTMETDLRGPTFAIKYAIPAMIASGGGGAIINTSSISGQVGEMVLTAYAAAKAGLIQLTRSVATQWGKQGIRCNAVAPGLILTPSAEALPEGIKALYLRQTLTPYLGQAQDVANLVTFLASEEARFITGEVIKIDGGLTSHNGFFQEFVEWQEQNPVVDWTQDS